MTTIGSGSSPRGRGKLSQPARGGPSAGLIPARAGKTVPGPDTAGMPGAHPRAGGENAAGRARRQPGKGSSPRGRGKRLFRETCITCRVAHPRAGGENVISHAEQVEGRGSSPRWRGKHGAVAVGTAARRLIPALAGKTASVRGMSRSRAAHPRAGGENIGPGACPRARAGSSPRGRGKHRRPEHRGSPPRLIPALAGKTDGVHWSLLL